MSSSALPPLSPNPSDAQILAYANQPCIPSGIDPAPDQRILAQIETDPIQAVQVSLPEFNQQLETELQSQSAPDLMSAIEAVAGNFPGLGPQSSVMTQTLYQATSCASFYTYNIKPTYKLMLARRLGILSPLLSSPVYAVGNQVYWAWVEDVMSGTPMESMLIPGSKVVPEGQWSWWTSSAEAYVPTPSNFQQANDNVFFNYQMVALAPDWYPYGVIACRYMLTESQTRRPTSFDGANPLWVQWPLDIHATTGGGRDEMLVQGPLTVEQTGPFFLQSVDPSLPPIYKTAAVLDTYASNVCICLNAAIADTVNRGLSPETNLPAFRVAYWQQAIVTMTQKTRAQADAAAGNKVPSYGGEP